MPWRSLETTTAFYIIREVVYLAVECSYRILFLCCKLTDIFWSVTNVTLLVSGSKFLLNFPKPIWARVISEIPEIVISRVRVGSTDYGWRSRYVRWGIAELHARVDAASDSVAESGDLHREKVRSVNSCIGLERFLGYYGWIVSGNKSTQIEDLASDRYECAVTGLAIVRRKLCCRIDVLMRADEPREYDDKENDKGATEPDKKIDGKLLAPCQSNVLSFHPTNPLDEEVWNVEC